MLLRRCRGTRHAMSLVTCVTIYSSCHCRDAAASSRVVYGLMWRQHPSSHSSSCSSRLSSHCLLSQGQQCSTGHTTPAPPSLPRTCVAGTGPRGESYGTASPLRSAVLLRRQFVLTRPIHRALYTLHVITENKKASTH